MTPEDKDALDAYRKGEHLQGLVNSQAWDVLLEILQDEVKQSEKKLLSASTTDEGEILAPLTGHGLSALSQRSQEHS